MNQKEIDRALADKDYWESFCPEGWSVYGFSFRSSAGFRVPFEIGGKTNYRVIEISSDHIDLLNLRFQAGLKRGAEWAKNCYEPVGSDDYQRGFGEAKRAIEQAILKECDD